MPRFQLIAVPLAMNQQQPLSPQTPPPPVILMQLPAAGFYGGSSFYARPVYQGPRIAPRLSQQPQHPNRYQPPISGPSRNRRKKGARKAEHPYSYQFIHEWSGTANYDPSTGIDLGHPWIDANNNPRIGKVWRTPSTTPLMADRDCILT